jgi:hypothetical protein
VSKELIKKVNKLLYGFMWKGKVKVTLSVLANEIEDGGLKMLDIQYIILSQRIIRLQRFIDNYPSPWKLILSSYLSRIGGKFILKCNYDTRKLLIYLPDFHRNVMKHGRSFHEMIPHQLGKLYNHRYGTIDVFLLIMKGLPLATRA